MLHLAQVKKSDPKGQVGLQLLAHQQSETTWAPLQEEAFVPAATLGNFTEGTLVLLEREENGTVTGVTDATDWVVDLVKTYLASDITPEFLQQETERAEQWRQSLTLQSQELGRRALEVEARREKMQELEDNLKREREDLEKEKKDIAQKLEQLDKSRIAEPDSAL